MFAGNRFFWNNVRKRNLERVSGREDGQRNGSKGETKADCKNRSAMRTWGLMLNFIPFGWNAVLNYQYLGVELLQVKR